MLSHEEQISILVHLSKADKVVADEEYELILFIGKELGISEEKIAEIIDNPKSIPELKNLSSDEKFNYVFNIIRMMKVDGRIHSKEIKLCKKLATSLGYKSGVISQLSAYIYKDSSVNSDRSFLRSIADEYLLPLDKDEEG